MGFWVRFKFKVPPKEIDGLLKKSADFYREDIRALPVGYMKGKPAVFALQERDELRDRPIYGGKEIVGAVRSKKPVMRNVLLKALGGPRLNSLFEGLRQQIQRQPNNDHKVEDQHFAPKQVIETLKETRGLCLKLPNEKQNGTHDFMRKIHRIRINYSPSAQELTFEVETKPTTFSPVNRERLTKKRNDWQKAYIATAHNVLTVVTKPLTAAGVRPAKTEYQPFYGTHFLVSPNQKALQKGGFVTMKNMVLRYIHPELVTTKFHKDWKPEKSFPKKKNWLKPCEPFKKRFPQTRRV